MRPVDRDRTPQGSFGTPPGPPRSSDTGSTPRPPAAGKPVRRVEPARGGGPVVEQGRPPQSRPGARMPAPEADGPPTDIYDEPIRPDDDRPSASRPRPRRPASPDDPKASTPRRRPSPSSQTGERPLPPTGRRPAPPTAATNTGEHPLPPARRRTTPPADASHTGERPIPPARRRPASVADVVNAAERPLPPTGRRPTPPAGAANTGERPIPPTGRRPTPSTDGARRPGGRGAGRAGERTGDYGPDAVGDRRAGPERTSARGPGTPRGKRPAAAPARTPTEDDRPTEVTPPIPRRSVTRRTKVTRHTRRTFGRAMGATLAATVVPGSGLLMINRKRAGGLVLGVFLLAVVALVIIGFTARRAALVQNLLSSRVLLVVMVGLVLAALAWITQIVRTYALARPRMLDPGRRVVGVVLVAALCLLVASPFGYAAQLVNSQRSLLDNLFGGGGGTSVAEAIAKPRLNVLLVGSDAGPDRTGARTDTMMLASIDTTTARTTLFALPRNIGYAQFPPGTPMAEKFPKGFHDAVSPLSGDYLLNAVYAWGLDHPADAPTTPTANPGLNLLHETVAYMLGVDIDYYVEVNMAGLTSIIDAVGGVTVDVGPTPLPIGGVLPDGRHVRPSGYVPAGVQHLDGDQALWFARSRRDSDDYSRMGRQRCLLQSMLQQKSPADVITRFQDIAAATSNSVATNIPQEVLGALVALAGDKPLTLQSISFDPNLPDPNERDGRFNTSRVDVSYMREVVQNAFAAPTPAPPPTTTQAPPTTASRRAGATPTPTVAPTAAPAQLACGS